MNEFLRGKNSERSEPDALKPFRFLPDHLLSRVIVNAGLDELSVRDWLIRLVQRECDRREKRGLRGRKIS